MRLKEDRSLLLLIILSIITFGIYNLFFIHGLAKDTNIACAEDGKKTAGLGMFILLSIITAGIYGFIWQMMVLDRWNSYIQRNRGVERISIVGYLLWVFLGSLIIIGPIVAAYKYLHSMNDVARIYNTKLVNAR